jgi:hypothetical protein
MMVQGAEACHRLRAYGITTPQLRQHADGGSSYIAASSIMVSAGCRSWRAIVPYKIHTVLTNKWIHFTSTGYAGSVAADIKSVLVRREPFRTHAFELACARHDIVHRLTNPHHHSLGLNSECHSVTIESIFAIS